MENVAAIKCGDEKVFEAIFNSFHKKVFGFFMKRTKLDRELSKELTQLAFIKLWNAKHTLSAHHPLDKQLFIIANHTLIDFIRREAKLTKVKSLVATTMKPEQELENTSTTLFEGTNYVLDKLKVLPPVRKKVLQLKVLDGYSNKQIASVLSISIKTVEGHITKGLHELKTVSSLSILFIVFAAFFSALVN